MRHEKIAAILRAETEKRRRVKRQIPASVQGWVRASLSEILDARKDQTWDEIARLLAANGLRWANGNRVTGQHLRTIVSNLLRTGNAPVASYSTVSALVRSADRRSNPDLSQRDANREVAAEQEGAKMDRRTILDEIRRSEEAREKFRPGV